jgi:hypothetical protein
MHLGARLGEVTLAAQGLEDARVVGLAVAQPAA